MWQKETFHYRATESKEQLTSQYEVLLRHVERLKQDPGLSAVVYTQTTDVEGENNGLVTYDREVIKVDVDRVAKANRGELPPIPAISLSPPADVQPTDWKFTTTGPSEGWQQDDFDDAAWETASAPFGSKAWFLMEPRSDWSTSDIWLRREFTAPDPLPEGRYVFTLYYDDEAEIYINGVKAAEVRGVTNYVEHEVSPEAKAAMRPGKNILSVHARSKEGSQHIDVGLLILGK